MAGKPYEDPKSTTEQLLNLCWRLATELRAVYNTAKARLTREEADGLYLGKSAKAESAKVADTAAKAEQDGQGRVIASTYVTQTDAANTYLNKTGKAVSAETADSATKAATAGSATKASQDGQGRVIVDTYALKTDIPTVPEQEQADWAATSTSSKAFIKNKPGEIAVGSGLGLVQSPATNEPNHVLKADGSWGDATTYAKESTATSGYISIREAKGAYGSETVSEKLKVNPATGDIQVGKVNGVNVSTLATSADLASGLAGKLDASVAADTYLPIAKNVGMTGASASATGKAGLVPAPAAGAQGKFLRGDGTWQSPPTTTYSSMTGATTSSAGKEGLVPVPPAGVATRYLRSDGTWSIPPDTTYSVMVGATTSAAGKAGLVPAPDAGAQGKFLRGDGAWQAVLTTIANGSVTAEKLADVYVPVAGNRGALAGYETMGTGGAVTVSATTPDDYIASGDVTVADASTAGLSWTKSVLLTAASPTVTLGSGWLWAGGSAPTLKQNGLLVLACRGTIGIANFLSPS